MDRFSLKLCDVQGRLFEKSDAYGSESFILCFMNSKLAAHLDSPYNKFQWMGEEYLLEELKDEMDLENRGEKYSREILYWIGYLYRYWSFFLHENSKKIVCQAPPRTMKRNYKLFHTMDPEEAIENLRLLHDQKKNR